MKNKKPAKGQTLPTINELLWEIGEHLRDTNKNFAHVISRLPKYNGRKHSQNHSLSEFMN